MNRTEIIQTLIDKIKATSYLEIGIDNAVNFQKIICAKKVSVDPNTDTMAMHYLTSDDFFKNNTDKFDVIFIDGLHHADQVYKDILNSLKILNEGGFIICHDMNPLEESHQIIPFVSGIWNGDCWKAFAQLRAERNDLKMHVVDTDHGCGIISKGAQIPLEINIATIDYKFFDMNRKKILNLINVEEFKNIYVREDTKNIDILLCDYIMKPNDADNNFNLAVYYDDIGQTASAISYYLRTAERTENDLLKYECLIKAATCFEKQGTRKFTVKGLLQQAVSIQPKRPEGYYLLSKFYEYNTANEGRWLDSYTIASIGLQVAEFENLEDFRTMIDYPGKYGLLFQKAIVGWHCGLCEESKNIFMDLHTNYHMHENFATIVYNNLVNMNAFSSKSLTLYNKNKLGNIKHKFVGIENVIQNYSEAYQDMFVLSLYNGKKNGSYVEIGSGHPTYGSNTYLLEKDFGWQGVSLDISEEFVKLHGEQRSHTCLLKDATTINYEKFLKGLNFGDTIDYLQIDVDPSEISYKVLLAMPFDVIKFGIITFEHDYYSDPKSGVREKARKYLESYGYKLVVDNISPDHNRPYEDWFIHPDIISSDIAKQISKVNDTTKMAEKYMFGEI